MTISRSPVTAELRATLAIAAPLAAANLAQMAIGFTNTLMVGRLGGVPLAAAGLGGSLYFTIGITLQGIIAAVAPLAAQAFGAGDRTGAARIAGQGLALAGLFALPFVALIISLDRLLLWFGYDAALSAEIARYQHAIVWACPPCSASPGCAAISPRRRARARSCWWWWAVSSPTHASTGR